MTSYERPQIRTYGSVEQLTRNLDHEYGNDIRT